MKVLHFLPVFLSVYCSKNWRGKVPFYCTLLIVFKWDPCTVCVCMLYCTRRYPFLGLITDHKYCCCTYSFDSFWQLILLLLFNNDNMLLVWFHRSNRFNYWNEVLLTHLPDCTLPIVMWIVMWMNFVSSPGRDKLYDNESCWMAAFVLHVSCVEQNMCCRYCTLYVLHRSNCNSMVVCIWLSCWVIGCPMWLKFESLVRKDA